MMIACILSSCGSSEKGSSILQNYLDTEDEGISILQTKAEVDIKEAIIGTWKITEGSKNVNREYYPEQDYLLFTANGAWDNKNSADANWNPKKSNTYIISDGTIVIDSNDLVYQYTYLISISDNILKLQYPGEEPLYFERVS